MKVVSSALAIAALCGAANAQSLPPPSRTVYKCEEGGQVRYSDAPCIGATKIDVEPTRGLNKSTGKELVGPDIRRERQRDELADAVRPLTGMDRKQFDRAGRRTRLSPEATRECQRLDREIPMAEQAERQANQPDAKKASQDRLFMLRASFKRLACE